MSSEDDPRRMISWRSVALTAALILVATPLLWVAFNVDLPAPAELRETILSYGWAGWLVFIGLAAGIAVTPIPVTLPALVAGSLYGVVGGTLVSFSGVIIGSWIGYWLARAVGRRATMFLLGNHGPVVQKYLDNAGFWAMCTVRLMPGVPYWPVNYGAGALGVSHHAFVSTTLVATIPGQVSLVALGAFAVSPSVFPGVVLVVSWATVISLTWIAYRRWHRLNADTTTDTTTTGTKAAEEYDG